MFNLALKNLLRRRSRTLLTMLGVAFAIAFTVGLLSISEGFIVNVNKSFRNSSFDLLVMSKGEGGFNLPFLGGGEGKELDQSLAAEIESLPNVERAYPILMLSSFESSTDSFLPLLIEAFPPEAIRLVVGSRLGEGRFFAVDELAVVAGASFANSRKLAVGDSLELQQTIFRLVGILPPRGAFQDSELFMPLETAQRLFAKQGKASSFGIQVKEQSEAEETGQLIQAEIEGVEAVTAQEALEQTLSFIQIARAIHFSLATISLLIGVLFVMTTMIMSVSERVKELGTLRAIGAPRRFIFGLVLTESFLISLSGGVIGVLGGMGLAFLLTTVISGLLSISFFEAIVTLRIIFWGLGIAVLVGLIAGMYPAWTISRLNIVKALHYE